ncbi:MULTISPECIES: HesB/YadR/YfhF family protein [Salimicrobium]|uniref:Uncharacterized protein n=1 Tax=Salimicrobium humidisoli TaxID=2029857 RepID=A0ABX4HP76_9BACI|nr:MULTISPECIES: hypothetical protein [Salimicrobium]PBB04858.1 hypothetical protein CKW00_11980 [Salimicrobium humidisoli]
MNITVSEEAAQWYKEEMDLTEGDAIQFFVRYGGSGGLQPGLSLGMKIETPYEPVAETNVEGILFFVEKADEWYFDTYSLKITYDENLEEAAIGYE